MPQFHKFKICALQANSSSKINFSMAMTCLYLFVTHKFLILNIIYILPSLPIVSAYSSRTIFNILRIIFCTKHSNSRVSVRYFPTFRINSINSFAFDHFVLPTSFLITRTVRIATSKEPILLSLISFINELTSSLKPKSKCTDIFFASKSKVYNY